MPETTEPISRIVAVIDQPTPVEAFADLTTTLEAEHGPGLIIRNGRWTGYEIRTPGRVCGCGTCEDLDATAVRELTGDPMRTVSRFMILCPDCGNKRCPRANHHDNTCSGSNEPGQPGSAYEHAALPGDDQP